LAKLRAAVVNMRALAEVGRRLELGSFLRLGRGEEATGGRDKASILADTLEALIGAVYLDSGLDAAGSLVRRLFDPVIEASATLGAGLDWKTSLQELTAELSLGVPDYVVAESGPDHLKSFTATARVGRQPYGEGAGRSKKEAEQQAAAAAWRALRAEHVPVDRGRVDGVPLDGVPEHRVPVDGVPVPPVDLPVVPRPDVTG
jgi:ribonuclease-3